MRLGRAPIATDPGFAAAHTFVSMCLHLRFLNGWMADSEAEAEETQRPARCALEAGYDRCATIFFGAITLAAIVIFWLGQ